MSGDAPRATVFPPDFDNRIDLPGAGPCPRPVDLDRARAGLERLVSLRVYRFPAGVVIDGEAEEDEVFMVLMRGEADVAALQDGVQVGEHALRTGSAERALYLPPHAAYQLTARTKCDVAYARSRPVAGDHPASRGFAAVRGELSESDYALGMRLRLIRIESGDPPPDTHAEGERFLHVRSDDGGALQIEDAGAVGDWHAAAVVGAFSAKVEGGEVELLEIAAR